MDKPSGSVTPQQRRTFHSTLDRLKTALKSPSKEKATVPEEKKIPKKFEQAAEGINSELEEIEKRLKDLPEPEIFKGESPQIIRETPEGIEKLGSIPAAQSETSPQTPRGETGSIETFVDATDKLEDLGSKQKEAAAPAIENEDSETRQARLAAMLEKNAQEALPSVTQHREESESDTTEDSAPEESDLEIREPSMPTKPEPLPTMEQERESLVEEEAKWVKEHHMEPEEELVQEPPSLEIQPGHIEALGGDSDPDIVSETARQHKGQVTDRDDEMISALKENKDSQVEKQKLSENYDKLRSDYERELDKKAEELKKMEEESAGKMEDKVDETFNMETLIKYLNDNKTVLEENFSENDRDRMRSALNITQDVKLLCREAIDTLKIDLLAIYNLAKGTLTSVMSEVGKSLD